MLADDLEALLSSDAASVEAELRLAFRRSGADLDRLVFFGAGNIGRYLLARARTVGIEPLAFADDTEKCGTTVDGLRVLSPEDAAVEFEGPTFVVTILNPALPFARARRCLAPLGTPVVSFAHLARLDPEAMLPIYHFADSAVVLDNAERVREAFEELADDDSRRQFITQLAFRLRLDFEALPQPAAPEYFPTYVTDRLDDDCLFIDGGAYDGDTVRLFLDVCGERFGRIVALEPDRENFARLQMYVERLPLEVQPRIDVRRAGIGREHATSRFVTTGDMSARFGAGGDAVEVVTVDELVGGFPATAYVKLDIEGAEWDAIEGASELIRRSPPIFALAAYHRPTDLWELPLALRRLSPAYSLRMRTEGYDGTDVVCYAVP
jgi:FkbM family methyltransferase